MLALAYMRTDDFALSVGSDTTMWLGQTIPDQTYCATPASAAVARVTVVDAGGLAGDTGRPAALIDVGVAGRPDNRGDGQAKEGLLRRASMAMAWGWEALGAAASKMWTFARADLRKAMFAAKARLSLTLISLLIFLRKPRDIVSHSV